MNRMIWINLCDPLELDIGKSINMNKERYRTFQTNKSKKKVQMKKISMVTKTKNILIEMKMISMVIKLANMIMQMKMIHWELSVI